MSNVFGNVSNEGIEEQEDRLGGFQIHDSNIYAATVKALYSITAASGAKGVVLVADLDGSEYSETVYVTNKKGENFFEDKDTKKKKQLPGWGLMDSLAIITTGKHLNELNAEDKVFKVWDTDAKKALPKSVPMFTEVLGKPVHIGILKETVDKTVKDSNGVYQPTGETREQNSIDKFFHPETKQTYSEAKDGKPGEFYDKWLEKNKGKTVNKAKGAGEGAGKAGRPGGAAPQAQQQARTSLFGQK
jgi:hypothetical protein